MPGHRTRKRVIRAPGCNSRELVSNSDTATGFCGTWGVTHGQKQHFWQMPKVGLEFLWVSAAGGKDNHCLRLCIMSFTCETKGAAESYKYWRSRALSVEELGSETA